MLTTVRIFITKTNLVKPTIEITKLIIYVVADLRVQMSKETSK